MEQIYVFSLSLTPEGFGSLRTDRGHVRVSQERPPKFVRLCKEITETADWVCFRTDALVGMKSKRDKNSLGCRQLEPLVSVCLQSCPCNYRCIDADLLISDHVTPLSGAFSLSSVQQPHSFLYPLPPPQVYLLSISFNCLKGQELKKWLSCL